MEQLLHYVWKHKILPLRPLLTTDGKEVEVLNPGIHNTNAGPDFFNAKIKINGVLWIGNVELHVRSTDWYRHRHESDAAYSNIILHVVAEADASISYPDGKPIPQLQIDIPEYIRKNFDSLTRSDNTPRCKAIVQKLPKFMIHSWMSALQSERLEERTKRIMERRESLNKNWEDTLFVTIARNFGFGINGDAFEQWAHSIPMNTVAKHRDNLVQIEAIFFGQAGLLTEEALAKHSSDTGSDNEYLRYLQNEYRFLKQKFSLTPIPHTSWRFLRLRPQNFPHIRIAQLAMLYYKQNLNLSRLINADNINDIHNLLQTGVSEYWKSHYTFASAASTTTDKGLSKASLNLIIINSVAPILFAYGKYKSEEHLCERAINLLESIKPEDNRIVREWSDAGVSCESAADSQALIQLTHSYCLPHNCLRCRFGYEFIRQTPGLLRENKNQI
ncbi:MAG: DUF2851 family protein [Bacteroidaceae bacterium]|nr:DUF2851 family protein [Bacteroidaceae bacterium]